MRSSPPSLFARGVTRRFGTNVVLDNVDLALDGPGLWGLVGDNGAGKTTLLRVLAQLAAPDAGTLAVCGVNVERADAARARAVVGWVPHEPLAWRADTVHHNLMCAARLAGLTRRAATECVAELIDVWQLGDVRERAVRHLSRGWQQRYSLARADLTTPRVMLLDEPTTGLDTAARSLLDAALTRWRGERIVLVSSHEHAWLASLGATMLTLRHGRVCA